jgi:hypothetical protein
MSGAGTGKIFASPEAVAALRLATDAADTNALGSPWSSEDLQNQIEFRRQMN